MAYWTEQAIELLMQLRIKSEKKEPVTEKDLYDVQLLLYRELDVALPLHREQGEQLYCLTDWGALLKVERMADAGKKITTVCVSDPDAVDAGMEISTEDIIRFFGKEEYLKLKTTPHPSTPAGEEVDLEKLRQRLINILYEANGTGSGADDIIEELKKYTICKK